MTRLTYSDSISLPNEMTLGTVQMIEEYLRGIGSVDSRFTSDQPISFTFEVEGDLWDACLLAHEVKVVLASHGIDYEPSRFRFKEVEGVASA